MKTGRNDPCPCGSGKKYKKCCMGADGGVALRQKILFGLIATGIVLLLASAAVVTLRHGGLDQGGDDRVWSEEHRHWHRQ